MISLYPTATARINVIIPLTVKPEPLEPAAPSDSKKRSAEDALLGREASAADGPVGTDGGAVDASAPEGEAAATELEANDEEEAPEVKRSRVGQ